MLEQEINSFDQFLPLQPNNLQTRLKSNNWNTRRGAYEQILSLLAQQTGKTSVFVLEVCGKQYEYTSKKLISFFKDIVDEQHPLVLLTALQCVEVMVERGLCSGKQLLKLTDQGFDKFPLKTNRGKEIQQKFADIVEKMEIDAQFLGNKLSAGAHQKCIIFALEVASMMGMTVLIPKIREIAIKHQKESVREVASQIYEQLVQLLTQQQQSQQSTKPASQFKLNTKLQNSEQNRILPSKQKQKTKTAMKSLHSAQQKQSNMMNKLNFEILEKISQFQQLPNKEQQKYCENLTGFFQRYYAMVKEGKSVPLLPSNQLTNLSYLIRIMIDSNNLIFSTNGLKLLRILSQNNNQSIPRSYPLLFILQKYRLHATHQINQLLYQVCDSLLLCNSISCMRNIDLLQAIGESANNKKINVKYGSFMVFVRCVAVLYRNQQLFEENFGGEQYESSHRLTQIYNKINEGDLQRIRQKLYRTVIKVLQIFTIKLKDEKKYEQKIQQMKIIISFIHGTSNAVSVQSIGSTEGDRMLKKNYSQGGGKGRESWGKIDGMIDNQNQKMQGKIKSSHNIGSLGSKSAYKVINLQEKTNKILSLCSNPTPNSIPTIKKLINESLSQFQQCLHEQRFQLFYYSQIVQNFIRLYVPHQKTTEMISEYLIEILLKISKIKQSTSGGKNQMPMKYLSEGISNIVRVCLCQLVVGEENLQQILTNISVGVGMMALIESVLGLDEQGKQVKIKKKNRKVFVRWMNNNVPNECLSDRLFEVIEKVQGNLPLGRFVKQQKIKQEYKQGKERVVKQAKWQSEVKEQIEMVKKITFSKEDSNSCLNNDGDRGYKTEYRQRQCGNQYATQGNKKIDKSIKISEMNQPKCNKQQENENQQNNKLVLSNNNKLNLTKNEKVSGRVKQKQRDLKNAQQKFKEGWNKIDKTKTQNVQNIIKNETTNNQLPTFKTIFQPLTNFPQNIQLNHNVITPLQIIPFQHSQISHIEHVSDYSVGCNGSTDREILKQCTTQQTNLNILKNNDKLMRSKYIHEEQSEDDVDKKQLDHLRSEKYDGLQKMEAEYDNRGRNDDEQPQYSSNLNEYKQYITKIRQTYLPHLNHQKYQQKQVQNSKEQQQLTQIPTKNYSPKIPTILKQSPQSSPPSQYNKYPKIQKQNDIYQQQQQKQYQFSYKLINVNKLNIVLENLSNPYQSLKNDILIPFKKSETKQYFLKQLNLFITSIPEIKQPQPYNSLLLTIILLFSQIQQNRSFITPLQQLYEYMSTLISTNEFLRIIISLFYAVIKQTTQQLRTFLITILTKSIGRLMPFCQNPTELLKDIAHFYNVGEQLYFQMYQQEYEQICTILEGQALYDVVEKALIKEGTYLQGIVQNWFNTKFKNKVTQYIKSIIQENEEGENDKHDDIGEKKYF